MGWLSGWSYRKEITVSNSLTTALSNYQTKIVLSSSNFDFSHANSDGSDIRFTESDGTTSLYYWVEKWDSTNLNAMIWVKVSSIPASGSTTIYMYYGNSNAATASDGTNTFIFFDDFSGDLSKWTQQTGTWGISSGELTVTGDYGTAPGNVITAWNMGSETFIAEMDATLGNGDGRFALYKSTTDVYAIGEEPGDGVHEIQHYNGSWTTNASVSSSVSSGDKVSQQVIYDGSQIIVNDLTNNLQTSYSVSISDYLVGIHSNAKQNPFPYFDNFRVREYASSEPSISISSEETVYYISGTVKQPDGTAVSDCEVIAIDESTYTITLTTTTASDGTYTLDNLPINSDTYTVIAIPSDSTQNGDIKCHVSPANKG